MADHAAKPALPDIEAQCEDAGLRMTEQRRVIARVLTRTTDHPDVDELYRRVSAIDETISLSTLYRTLRVLQEADILERHDFGNGKSHYEAVQTDHHDHLIDVDSGAVVEFSNADIEQLQERVARELGYELVGHRLELYGRKISADHTGKMPDPGATGLPDKTEDDAE